MNNSDFGAEKTSNSRVLSTSNQGTKGIRNKAFTR